MMKRLEGNSENGKTKKGKGARKRKKKSNEQIISSDPAPGLTDGSYQSRVPASDRATTFQNNEIVVVPHYSSQRTTVCTLEAMNTTVKSDSITQETFEKVLVPSTSWITQDKRRALEKRRHDSIVTLYSKPSK